VADTAYDAQRDITKAVEIVLVARRILKTEEDVPEK
jgi:hypothetical protein